MPSKGILAFAYIASGLRDCSIEFAVPKHAITKVGQGAWSRDHLEVDTSNISGFGKFKGRFEFRVRQGGRELTYQWNEINALTGNLDEGTMTHIKDTASIQSGNLMISYGFYDSGSGQFGLPNKHICYVTVSSLLGGWMGSVAPVGSPEADRPFSRFVLPAPHDCGMNSMQSVDLLLQSDKFDRFRKQLGYVPGIGELLSLAGCTMTYVADVIYSIALTQKDDIQTMMRVGARYFEFRAAQMPKELLGVPGLGSDYYFMHAVIPGLSYKTFLVHILEFLRNHQTEIVVVHLRGDGVIQSCSKPDAAAKGKLLSEALAGFPKIKAGNMADMRHKTVKQLREEGKRLIVIESENQYSSYDDAKYATLDGDSIVNALKGMNMAGQAGHSLTLMQCQATPSNIKEVVRYAVTTSNASTSVLMATKAMVDFKTYPWLKEHCRGENKRFKLDQTMVLMNDWFDGATADLAVQLSKSRFNVK